MKSEIGVSRLIGKVGAVNGKESRETWVSFWKIYSKVLPFALHGANETSLSISEPVKIVGSSRFIFVVFVTMSSLLLNFVPNPIN